MGVCLSINEAYLCQDGTSTLTVGYIFRSYLPPSCLSLHALAFTEEMIPSFLKTRHQKYKLFSPLRILFCFSYFAILKYLRLLNSFYFQTTDNQNKKQSKPTLPYAKMNNEPLCVRAISLKTLRPDKQNLPDRKWII